MQSVEQKGRQTFPMPVLFFVGKATDTNSGSESGLPSSYSREELFRTRLEDNFGDARNIVEKLPTALTEKLL
jgi:hypothetical protein